MLDSRYEKLIEALMPLVRELLEEQHTLLPFAAALNTEGEVSLVDPSDEIEVEGEINVDEIYASVVRVLQQNASDLTAVAICVDAEAVPPGSTEAVDTIVVAFESPFAEPVQLGIPYQFDRKGKAVFGEIFTAEGEMEVFGA